ncbi:MAG: hypothetical protein SXA11_08520 [Cyanobacteriota bacterium]|nr:hypothetical protein [Cyanobacteriota bacterium]
MKPKITTTTAWKQAELLMQPSLLRVLDNLRKTLETSSWKGTYEKVQTPIPGYRLDLEERGQKVSVNIWELCYQICFSNYRLTHAEEEEVEVEIDTSLIDENGEVDWDILEEKTCQVIENFFAELPKVG